MSMSPESVCLCALPTAQELDPVTSMWVLWRVSWSAVSWCSEVADPEKQCRFSEELVAPV